MWTTGNWPIYNRNRLRYPSNLTDAECGHVEALIAPTMLGGRKLRRPEHYFVLCRFDVAWIRILNGLENVCHSRIISC